MKLPKRSNNLVIENYSDNYLRKSLPDWWALDRPSLDFGNDFVVDVVEHGEYMALQVIGQIKSSRRYLGDKQTEPFQIRISTLNLLRNDLRVAILIKYNLEQNIAYWEFLKNVKLPNNYNQEEMTVRIPIANVLNQDAWSGPILAHVKKVTGTKLEAAKQIKPNA